MPHADDLVCVVATEDFWWKGCGNRRRVWIWRVWKWILEKRRARCVRSARVRLGNQKSIHVVFAYRVFVGILLCALRVTDGFIKGAVASQVDWGTILISNAGYVLTRMWCWERLDLSSVVCAPTCCYLGDIYLVPVVVYIDARARVKCVWAEFKELSSILTARCASYRNERERFIELVYIVFWSMWLKPEHSRLKIWKVLRWRRLHTMMVRWWWTYVWWWKACEVSLIQRDCSDCTVVQIIVHNCSYWP